MDQLYTVQLHKRESLANSMQKCVEGERDSVDSSKPILVVDAAVTAAAIAASPEMEERLKCLEANLGVSSNTSSSTTNNRNKSLLERLEILEHLPFDDKKLDLVQKRVKVIRQDLEAAVKARSKLMTVSASAEDSKSIAALYDQLQSLQGVAQHLPALSARLQSLAHQHVDAATRSTRFQAIEQVTTNLSHQVTALEVTLQTLEASVKLNATSMQQNMQVLEDRMKAMS